MWLSARSLESALRSFLTLTKGSQFSLMHNEQEFGVMVVDLKPDDACSIVDTGASLPLNVEANLSCHSCIHSCIHSLTDDDEMRQTWKSTLICPLLRLPWALQLHLVMHLLRRRLLVRLLPARQRQQQRPQGVSSRAKLRQASRLLCVPTGSYTHSPSLSIAFSLGAEF